MAVTVFRVGTAAMRVGTGAAYQSAGPASPSDIALSANTIADNASSGTDIGTLSATDTDSSSFTWTIVSQPSGNPFALSGTNPAATIVLERSGTGTLTAGDKTVRIRADDGSSTPYEEDLTVTVSLSGTETQLTTFTITNESGSAESAGKVSQLFGVLVPPGKIPDGMYPEIRLNDGTTVQPSFVAGRRNHPSGHPTGAGSWSFFMCAFRLPATSGSATNTYQLWSSNTAPSSSGLANNAASSASIAMEIDGVTNLSGTWTASVNTGVTDADDITTFGDAGVAKLISVGQDFMQSGSPHGQMYMRAYLMLLKDGSGNFAGVRTCLRAQQGWTDVSSPTATRRIINARLMAGASTRRTLQGYDTTPSLSTSFVFAHYTRIFSVGTDGKWDYEQAGGSQSADTTTGMPVFSKDWLSASQMIFFDPAGTNSSNSTISYYPNANGPLLRDMSAGGERDEIGVVPNQCAKHFFNRAAVDWQAIRALSLITAGWRTCLLDSTTKKIVTGRNNSYTGLGTARPTWRYFPGTSVSGVQSPSTELGNSLWQSDTEPSHRPSYSWYAYLMTGSPEHYDIMCEHAAGMLLYGTTGTGLFTAPPVTGGASCYNGAGGRQPVVSGTTYDGSMLATDSNLVRLYAWAFRDIVQAHSIQPATAFTSADIAGYFNDLVDASLGFFNAYNAYIAATSTNWNTAPYNMLNGGGGDDYEGTWTQNYLGGTLAASVAWTWKSAAVTATNRMRDYLVDLYSRGGAAACGAYHLLIRNHNGDRIEDGANLAYLMTAGPTLSWVASTDVFTMGGGLTPTNGDLIGWSSFDAPGAPGAWATNLKMFEVINASGQTFKLAQRGSGTPLDVTSDGSCSAFYGRVANCGSLPDYQNGWDYLPNSRMVMRMMQMVGTTGLSTARSGVDSAFSANDATEGPAAAKYRAATAFATV